MPCHPLLSIGPTIEKIGYRQLNWPGDGKTNPDVSYQYLDREYMSADEYDDYIHDPTGFYLHKYLPRVAEGFDLFDFFPDYPSIYFTGLLISLTAFAGSGFSYIR